MWNLFFLYTNQKNLLAIGFDSDAYFFDFGSSN